MDVRRLWTFDGGEASAWRAGSVAGRHAALVTARQTLLRSLAADDSNPNRHREAWGAWDGDTCVGGMLVEWSRRENPHRAGIDVGVPAEHRRRGVGGALWEAGLAQVRAAGRDTVNVEVNVPHGQRIQDWPGGRFALARGFVSGLVEDRWVLGLPVPEEVSDAADQPAAGYRGLTWHGPVPPEWLPALAALTSEMSADVPAGELDVEAETWDAERIGANQERLIQIGYALVTTIVVTEDGEPAGYTQMFVEGDGTHVHQDDTYVRPAHRGHRLGTFAKARNLRGLTERHPQARHVHTWTADGNDAMRKINTWFGFRAVEAQHSMEAVFAGR
ncbi:GNAT family N-acetyltransferase [Actinoplanes sp. NPDC049802]|uniref:GNAT family N-acetyltransferase n=1 Tax=Actinoplanes sp. NPDC049802 TaxID=3154742 RepID=UPI00340F2711